MLMGTLRTLATAVLAAGAVSASATAEELRIGALYPLSGAGAIYGSSAMQGHELAADRINAAGGVDGREVVTLTRDTQLNPSLAAAAARELITKDDVHVLVGTVSSGVAIAIAEVAKREGVPFIATIAKTIQLTGEQRHDYVFRVATNTDFEGDAIAQMLVDHGKPAYCDIQLDYAYGHDLADGIQRGLERRGSDIERMLSLRVKLGAQDYSLFVSQLMGAGCEVVTSGLWGTFFVNFVQQAKPFGLFDQITLINGGEAGGQEVVGRMGEDYPDNVIANAYEVWYFDPVPEHAEFQQALAEKTGEKATNNYPVLGYTVVQFAAEAARKAGSTDGAALAKALSGLTIETPVGERTLDAETHQSNTGQFWGPMRWNAELGQRVMDPVGYVPPMGDE